jgi:hypothetical protein
MQHGAAVVGEAGIARADEQGRLTRQRGHDVVGDPVGEEFLLGSPLILVKGSAAIEGLSQRQRGGRLGRPDRACSSEAEGDTETISSSVSQTA